MTHGERTQLQNKSRKSSIVTAAGIKRSRIRVSCNACRRTKMKCVRGLDEPTCLRCRQNHLQCVFDGSKLPATKGAGPNGQGTETHRLGHRSDNSVVEEISEKYDEGLQPHVTLGVSSSLFWFVFSLDRHDVT
jgi:hypothetical protein